MRARAVRPAFEAFVVTACASVPAVLVLASCGARTGLLIEAEADSTDAGPAESSTPDAEIVDTSLPDIGVPDAVTPGSSKVVLFGGQPLTGGGELDDTWLFDGTTWSQFPAASPPARIQATMARLGAQSNVVLFGGAGNGSTGLADTWIFDGTVWAEVAASGSPPGRSLASMAALGDRVVLFGGWDSGGQALGDTWTFDGQAWTPVKGPGPSARAYATMASLGGRVILFGGADDNGTALDDTWSFDGHAWTQLMVTTVPHATYDALGATLGGVALAFGGDWGSVSSGIGTTTIWAFDGQDWSMHVASPHPDYTWATVATLGDAVVLFGGPGNASSSNQTWMFRANAWSTVTVASAPAPRAWASMASLP
jgi:hypothetical protein